MRATTAAIVGLSIVAAAIIGGNYFYRARQTGHDIRVVGSASQEYEADIVKWRVTLGRWSGLGESEVRGGYLQLERDRTALTAYLTSNGIKPGEISSQPVNRGNTYDNQGRATGNSLTQTIDVVSPGIDAIERLALNTAGLYDKGITPQYSSLEYYLSKLPDIKKELLAAATRDAKARAAEIAKNSGARLGPVSSARAGVFQITEPYSTEVSDYGIYSTSTRRKNVTVTVTATFSLR